MTTTNPVVANAIACNDRLNVAEVKRQAQGYLREANERIMLYGENLKTYVNDIESYQYALSISKKIKSFISSL